MLRTAEHKALPSPIQGLGMLLCTLSSVSAVEDVHLAHLSASFCRYANDCSHKIPSARRHSPPGVKHALAWYMRHGVQGGCVQTVFIFRSQAEFSGRCQTDALAASLRFADHVCGLAEENILELGICIFSLTLLLMCAAWGM